MGVVKLNFDTKKPRKTAKKAVGVLEALLSAFRDPAVKEGIDAALDYQRHKAAEESIAGKAKQVFAVASDPRTLAVVEVMTTLAKRQLNKRTR